LIVDSAPPQRLRQAKVCFVYVGSRTPTAVGPKPTKRAALSFRRNSADKIETPFLENVAEGRIRSAPSSAWPAQAARWCSPPSFGYMDATVAAAKKFPKVKFEHATGFKSADNLGT